MNREQLYKLLHGLEDDGIICYAYRETVFSILSDGKCDGIVYLITDAPADALSDALMKRDFKEITHIGDGIDAKLAQQNVRIRLIGGDMEKLSKTICQPLTVCSMMLRADGGVYDELAGMDDLNGKVLRKTAAPIRDKNYVRKTTSVKLLKELQNYEQKKLDVSFTVKAKTGEALEIVINDGTFILSEKGNKIEKSQTSETTREMIVKQLSKLGNTPFRLKEIEIIKDDNIFISITELNSIRRNLVSKLIDKKTKIKPKEINKVVDKVINYKDNKETINIFVNNEEQYSAAKEENVDNIYTSNVFLHKKYPMLIIASDTFKIEIRSLKWKFKRYIVVYFILTF